MYHLHLQGRKVSQEPAFCLLRASFLIDLILGSEYTYKQYVALKCRLNFTGLLDAISQYTARFICDPVHIFSTWLRLGCVGKRLDIWNSISSKNCLSATTFKAALLFFVYPKSVPREYRPELTADPYFCLRDEGKNMWCLAPSSPKRPYLSLSLSLSLSLVHSVEPTLPSRFVAEELDQLTMFSVAVEWEYRYCWFREVFVFRFICMYLCFKLACAEHRRLFWVPDLAHQSVASHPRSNAFISGLLLLFSLQHTQSGDVLFI
jgi:hypothetical protein